MTRRLFFQRVFGTVAAATIGPFLPVPAHALGSFGSVPLVNGSTLAFHPDAFAMAMEPLEFQERYIRPAVAAMAKRMDDHIADSLRYQKL